MKMPASVSEQCRSTLGLLKKISSEGWQAENLHEEAKCQRANEELERLGLWAGNIGALHPPESPLSIEARLKEAPDVLAHIKELLEDLTEVAGERKIALLQMPALADSIQYGRLLPESERGWLPQIRKTTMTWTTRASIRVGMML